MDKKKIIHGAEVIAVILVAYFLIHRKKPVNSNTDIVGSPDLNPGGFIENPELASYNPNNAPQDINFNIANQGLDFLNSNYIPLFGFIGMMQGDFIQPVMPEAVPMALPAPVPQQIIAPAPAPVIQASQSIAPGSSIWRRVNPPRGGSISWGIG